MAPSGKRVATAAALSRLKSEIALNREFAGLAEAAFLSLVWTWEKLEKLGRRFFPAYGITDSQFNVLMILWDYRERTLRQAELAVLLVVNRASIGSVLERMERSGWIRRVTDPADRRAIHVSLSEAGIAKLKEVRSPYYELLSSVFEGVSESDCGAQIRFFDRLRAHLSEIESATPRRPRRKAEADER